MKHHFDANHLSSFKWQLLKNTIKSKWMESNLALLLTKQCENFQTERWMVCFFFKCKCQKLSPFQMKLLLKAMPVNERLIHLVFIEFDGFCNGTDWQSMEQRKAYCFLCVFKFCGDLMPRIVSSVFRYNIWIFGMTFGFVTFHIAI